MSNSTKNAALLIAYNQIERQLDLTKRAVASVLEQNIPVELFMVDNGSLDGKTRDWMYSIQKEGIYVISHNENISPVKVANDMMRYIFGLGYGYILGFPIDAILPPNLYREMLKCPRGVVTASMSGDENFKKYQEARAVNTCTPMAVPLIRKWVYDALVAKDGHYYDERFFHYCSDCDFALRIAACGIIGVQLDIEYFHFGSASWRMLPQDKGRTITSVADDDRRRFEDKWGFPVSSDLYGQSCGDINFRGEVL